MSLTTAAATALLEHLLNNADWANIGDAAGLQNSATAGSLYLSIHSSSPGAGGSQTTNEVAYGSYARVAIARSGAAWTVVAGVANPAAAINFAAGTSGSVVAGTHFGIGTASSGAGNLLVFGTITPNVQTGNGLTPQLTTATALTAS